MSEKSFNPQEVIIRELLERSSSDRIYDLSTLRFLKMHASGEYQLHQIACQTTTGESHSSFFVLRQWGKQGWDVEVIWPWPATADLEQRGVDNSPRVALGMTASGMTAFEMAPHMFGSSIKPYISSVEPQFVALGSVQSKEISIASVRLRSSNSILLEDVVEQGLVLFVSQKEVLIPPLWAELYDETGRCVNQHPLLGAEKGEAGSIDQ